MTTSTITQAVSLIHAGKIDAARRILIHHLQTDAHNESAWLWLAYTYNDTRRIHCLQRALEINPDNLRTRQYLAKLNHARTPHPPAITAEILPSGRVLFTPNLLSFLVLRPLLIHTALFIYNCGLLSARYYLRYSGIFIYIMYIITLLIITIILASPFYRVEITPTHLIGPARITQGLARIKVPLKNLDLHSTPTHTNWHGLYSIPTRSGNKILLLAFNQKQYQYLMNILRARTTLITMR